MARFGLLVRPGGFSTVTLSPSFQLFDSLSQQTNSRLVLAQLRSQPLLEPQGPKLAVAVAREQSVGRHVQRGAAGEDAARTLARPPERGCDVGQLGPVDR